ncbi:WXG100 family type VII secretion target [Actinokineospora sp.]|uniref:WXG100 family type VII secretion target n=1 Tax=Actinokineospora sp. TaxID=1872133 RepID=UPI004037FD7F
MAWDYDKDREGKYHSEAHKADAETRRRADRKRKARKRNNDVADFDRINWDAYGHEQLFDMVMSADPATMGDRATRWSDLSGQINETTGRVQNIVQGLLGTWRGPAAVRAGEANTLLTQWADEAGHRAARVGKGLSQYMDAVVQAQVKMPDPVFYYAEKNFMAGYDVKATDGPSAAIMLKQLTDDQQPSLEKRNAAKAEAVRVMRAYGSESQDVHTALPQFQDAPAPQPGTQTPTTPRPGPGPGGAGPGGAVPPGGPGSVPPGGGTGPGAGGSTGTSPSPIPNGTVAAGYADGFGPNFGQGYGSGTGYGAGGYGSGAGGGLSGSGGLAAGADSARGGGAFAGAGGLAARGAAAAAEAGAARGAGGGAGGMYPPMGGAGGTRGSDDDEHKNKYDDGLDLFDDLPPAYPPVFGA